MLNEIFLGRNQTKSSKINLRLSFFALFFFCILDFKAALLEELY